MTMRLRQSIAKVLVKQSPADALRQIEQENRRPTRAMQRGSLIDQLVFGQANYQVCDARYKSGPRKGELCVDWTASAAAEQREEILSRGQLPVLESELSGATARAGRIRAELLTRGFDIASAVRQQTVEWTTRLGVAAEGTPDVVFHNGDTLDLKDSDIAHPRALAMQIHKMEWDLQRAAYQETAGSRGKHWICVSNPATLNVLIAPLDEVYLEIGKRDWEAAQKIWQECLASGHWPEHFVEAWEAPRNIVRDTFGYDDDLSSLGLDLERTDT
jgi:hypothetical protein